MAHPLGFAKLCFCEECGIRPMYWARQPSRRKGGRWMCASYSNRRSALQRERVPDYARQHREANRDKYNEYARNQFHKPRGGWLIQRRRRMTILREVYGDELARIEEEILQIEGEDTLA